MATPIKQPQLDRHLQGLAESIEHVKALHATLTAVMIDLAALRNTVLNDPEDLSRYKEELQEAIEASKPLLESAMRSYDEMIQRIIGHEIWRN